MSTVGIVLLHSVHSPHWSICTFTCDFPVHCKPQEGIWIPLVLTSIIGCTSWTRFYSAVHTCDQISEDSADVIVAGLSETVRRAMPLRTSNQTASHTRLQCCNNDGEVGGVGKVGGYQFRLWPGPGNRTTSWYVSRSRGNRSELRRLEIRCRARFIHVLGHALELALDIWTKQ